MSQTNRPKLSLDVECQIEEAQNQIDLRYWNHLIQMQGLEPERARMLRQAYPMTLYPPAKKQPHRLLSLVGTYACELFDNEARFYPSDAQLKTWLESLASRVLAKTVNAVGNLEAESRDRGMSLEYHGVDQKQMINIIENALKERIAARLRPPKPRVISKAPPPPTVLRGGSYTWAPEANSKTVEPAQKEQPKDLAKARKAFIEALLTEKGWSILDWALEAGVAYHTAADYLSGEKNPYRSTRVKLATALGLPPNQLPE
jgi:lambda repressor-like predicted transcriptional regulator